MKEQKTEARTRDTIAADSKVQETVKNLWMVIQNSVLTLKTLQEENTDLSLKYNQLEKNFIEIESSNNKLIAEIEEFKCKVLENNEIIDSLKDRLKDYDEKYKDFQDVENNIVILQKENDQLKLELEEKEAMPDAFEELKKEFEFEYERAEKNDKENKLLTERLKEIENLKGDNDLTLNELISKNKKLKEKEDEIVALNNKIFELETQILDSNEKTTKEEPQFQSEIYDYKITELEINLDNLKSELRKEQNERLREREKYQDEITSFKKNIEHQDEVLKSYSTQLLDVKIINTDLERELKESKNQTVTINEELISLKQVHETVLIENKEFLKYKEEVNFKNGLIEEYTSQLKNLNVEAISKDKTLEALHEKISHLENKCKLLEGESEDFNNLLVQLKELENKIEQEKQQNLNLQMQINNSSEAINLKDNLIQEFENKTIELDSELNSVKNNIKHNESEIVKLSENKLKIRELEEIINSKNENIKLLKKQLEDEETKNKLNGDKKIILINRIDRYLEKIEKVLQK